MNPQLPQPANPQPPKARAEETVPKQVNLCTWAALLLPDEFHSTTSPTERDALMVGALENAERLWVHAGRHLAKMVEAENGQLRFSYAPTSKRFYPKRKTDQLREDLKRDFGINYSDQINTAYKLKASLKKWRAKASCGNGESFDSWLRSRLTRDDKTKEIYYLLSADDYQDYAYFLTSGPEHCKNGEYSDMARKVVAYGDSVTRYTPRT